MKAQGNNLIMMDFALQDRRSISAMLRGKGDGREQSWIEFSEKKRGFFSEEELYFLYQKQCERERIDARDIEFLKKALIAVGVLLAVVF